MVAEERSELLGIGSPKSHRVKGKAHQRKNAIVHNKEEQKAVEAKKVNNFVLQNAFQMHASDSDSKLIICDCDEDPVESMVATPDLVIDQGASFELEGTT